MQNKDKTDPCSTADQVRIACFGKFLKHYITNVRSYSLLVSNGVIFSTVGTDDSLTTELMAISACGGNISRSYGIAIGHWYTDNRLCIFQPYEFFRGPLTNKGSAQNINIYVLATAEPTMAPHNLEMRAFFFEKLMRALLKPRDFPSPSDSMMFSLSVNYDVLRKYVMRMDRLFDSCPALLSGAVSIHPGLSLTTRLSNTTFINSHGMRIPTKPDSYINDFNCTKTLISAVSNANDNNTSQIPLMTQDGNAFTEEFVRNEIYRYTTAIVYQGHQVVHMCPLCQSYGENPISVIDPNDAILLGIMNCIGVSHNIITDDHGEILEELRREMLPNYVFEACRLRVNTRNEAMQNQIPPEELQVIYDQEVESQLKDKRDISKPAMILTKEGEELLRDDVSGEVYNYFIADSDSEADDDTYKIASAYKQTKAALSSNANSSSNENNSVNGNQNNNQNGSNSDMEVLEKKSNGKNLKDYFEIEKVGTQVDPEQKVPTLDKVLTRFENTRYLSRKKFPFTPRKKPVTMYLYMTFKGQRIVHAITIVPLHLDTSNKTVESPISEHISVVYVTPIVWMMSESYYSQAFGTAFGLYNNLNHSRLSTFVSDAILEYIHPVLRDVFSDLITNASLSATYGEKVFSLRYLLSTSPGMVYFEAANRTRHSTIAPDLNPNEYIREHFVANNQPISSPTGIKSNLTIKQKLYNTLCKQIKKIQLAAHDVHAIAAKALSEGMTFYYERDGKYLKVYWLVCFYDKCLEFPLEIPYSFGFPESYKKCCVSGKNVVLPSGGLNEDTQSSVDPVAMSISGNNSATMKLCAAASPNTVKRVALGLTNNSQKGEATGNPASKIASMKSNDQTIETEYPGFFIPPISRGSMIALNRPEEIEIVVEKAMSNLTNRVVTSYSYNERPVGGYITTPQYFESARKVIEKNLSKTRDIFASKATLYCKEKKTVTNILGKEENSILCEAFGVFLNVVNIEDARAMMWKNLRDMMLQCYGQ